MSAHAQQPRRQTLLKKLVAASLALLLLAPQASRAAIFDITDYGGVAGDGISDLAAIQGAISAASAGDTVLMPAGAWSIHGSIRPKSGITLAGVGRDHTSVQYIGGSGQAMIQMQPIGGNPAPNQVELRGFTLDGLNNTFAHQGITASATSGNHIHNLRVQNLGATSAFGPHGIYGSNDVDHTVIENNEFLNIGVTQNYGGGVRLEWGSEHNQIVNNVVADTGRGGIFLKESPDNVIRGNIVTGSGKQTAGLGIEVFGNSHRTIVEDNTIDHWLSIDSSNLVAVRRNRVEATDGTLKFLGLELAGGSDVIFADNLIGQGSQMGLSMSNNTPKQRVFLSGNTFEKAETWNAQLQDDGGEIRQIYLQGNTFRETEGATPNLFGVPSTETHGFRFNTATGGAGIHQIVFDSNTFVDNDGAGLQFSGGDLDQFSFVGNTFTGNHRALANSFPGADLEFDPSNLASGNTVSNGLPSSSGFANGKPAVAISAPLLAIAGQPVAFDFLYSDDNSALPSQVLWDFSEGLPVVDLAPLHAFSAPGTYNVALVAWDPAGRAAFDVIQVNVLASAIPEPTTLILLIGLAALALLARWRRTYA